MVTRRKAIPGMCLAMALAWSSIAFGQQVSTVAAEVRAGDSWVYEVRDELTGDVRDTITVTVIEVTDKEINTRHNRKIGERPRPVFYDRTWARIDDSVWKFNPSDQIRLGAHLSVGQSWQVITSARNLRSGAILNGRGTARVTAAESITTPAGTFDSLLVETEIEQSQGRDASIISHSRVTLWYAPAIARWVRKTTEIRREGRIRDKVSENLISYERKR